MIKKRTMGINPLEAYLDQHHEKKFDLADEILPSKEIRQRITIHVNAQLIDRLKNVVFWEPGMTLTELAHQALQNELDKREAERGGPYPERKRANLRGGRPLS